MKVYVENKDKMTSYQWGYGEESERYFVKLNFDLPSNTGIKVLSLDDHDKQVRKEVVQELKNKMLYCSERFIKGCYYYNGKELDEIVDQIQGEK